MAADHGWALRAEGLGKEYVLGETTPRGRSLYEMLSEGWRSRRETGSGSQQEHTFWALRNVNFEVRRGEVVGIVGRNGAGKSTLLKILSRITAPSEGRVLLRGKLASLLEVGTGFHPELTGRENIFLNGTILGMRRQEIERKFTEIVEFAEIERFLDTPVKRYSSGMYVRLAFAVAAHLDADILLIDEVLAVGDAAFQRKSLRKMEEVAGGGRTVLFVSHNLGAVRSLCDSVVVLDAGLVTFRGITAEGLAHYEASAVSAAPALDQARFRGTLGAGLSFHALDIRQQGVTSPTLDPTLGIEILVSGHAEQAFNALEINLGFFRDGVRLFSSHDGPTGARLEPGPFTSRFAIPPHVLRPGRWTVGLGAYQPNGDWAWNPEVAAFDVSEHWRGATEARDTGLMTVPVRGARQQ
jgi:lipopolysaccharide transport system ATP-binding protein